MRLAAEFVQDARYALRGLRRAPGFASVAILTLALGIGANTAIFSVLYGVWLAPAPYAHADRLADFSMQQLSGHRFMGGTSYLNLADWKSQTRLVDAFGAHQYTHWVNIAGLGEAEEAIGHRVSANLFALLGAHPALGRPIDAAADRAAGPRQALIAWSWWMRRFGGDPAIAGKQILVNGEPFTITGVMPRGFEFPPMGSDTYRPVIWMSLSLADARLADRGEHSLDVLARLKKGVSLRRAQAEMDTIAARQAQAYPLDDGGWGVKVAGLTDGRPLEQVRPALLLLMGAAALVLLIACANIANLLTARASGREREMAVRRALGVTWQRLARQLLTESAILALCGGCAGLLLAYAGLPLLKSVLPASTPRADRIALHGTILAFAAALSLLTGLLFGLVPALRTQPLQKAQPERAMAGSRRSSNGARSLAELGAAARKFPQSLAHRPRISKGASAHRTPGSDQTQLPRRQPRPCVSRRAVEPGRRPARCSVRRNGLVPSHGNHRAGNRVRSRRAS